MKIKPKVELEPDGTTARIENLAKDPILVPREQIPFVVEALKDIAHQLNSTLDRLEVDDDEEENLGNIAMG